MGIQRLVSVDLLGRILLGAEGSLALGRSNTATLTGTTTLTGTSAPLQILDPGGSSRNLVFPDETQSKNLIVIVQNTADAAENLVCKASDGSTTKATISQNETALLYCEGTVWAAIVVPSGSAAGDYLLAAGTVTGASSQAQPFTNGITAAPALTATGQAILITETINHATADAEGIDGSVAQTSTARTSGTVSFIKGSTTSLAGDTGGDYAVFNATHTDGGGTATHYGLLVDSTSDVAVGSKASTAGGASAATAGLTIKSGNRTKNDTNAGVPTSGVLAIKTGDSNITAAATGGASGALTTQTGDTDCNDAGGTGGASGQLTLRSGNATSTLGTSGASGPVVMRSGHSDDGATGDVTVQSGNATAGNSGNVILQAGTAGGTKGKVQVSAGTSFDVDIPADHDVALTAAGEGYNLAVTIDHATASAEGLDVSITQLTTPRTAGVGAALKTTTTSLAGDTGGAYAGLYVVHTDGGGTTTHMGVLVDGTSDVALGTANSTAGGATAGTAAVVVASGSRTKNDADAGVPTSGAMTLKSGATDVTAAATGGVSGAMTVQSGNTDCNDAGGTGGASGVVILQSGDAASTLGTSGASGAVTVESGTSADATTGTVTIQSGNASTTSGNVVIQTGTGSTKGDVQITGTVVRVRGHKQTLTADPGNAQAIPVTDDADFCLAIGGGAETNTLAIPTYRGQRLFVIAETVGGGTRAITAASAINQAGNTIMTFNAANDWILLEGHAVAAAGTLAWRIVQNEAVALS